MRITISENQFKNIIVESKNSSIQNQLNKSENFFKSLVKLAKEKFDVDLKFLLTWGATIGGFIGPVSNFIESGKVNISEEDILLISIGCVLTYFSDNKKELLKILKKIKEKNLISEFNFMLNKCEKLKTVFLNFVGSLNISFYNISMMMGYTFLIPILPKLFELSRHSLDSKDINEIAKSIVLYFGSSLSSKIIHDLISQTVKKFRN
jgi:hypothetical protein